MGFNNPSICGVEDSLMDQKSREHHPFMWHQMHVSMISLSTLEPFEQVIIIPLND